MERTRKTQRWESLGKISEVTSCEGHAALLQTFAWGQSLGERSWPLLEFVSEWCLRALGGGWTWMTGLDLQLSLG